MDLAIAGRRAAVAGASAGLGLACAQALAAEGARAALCGRRKDRVDQAVATITSAGGEAVGIVADVSSTAGVTVNSIQPGSHATDRLASMHGGDLAQVADYVPVGALGRPEDFGAVVAFLSSDRARFTTCAALPIDGGASRGLQ